MKKRRKSDPNVRPTAHDFSRSVDDWEDGVFVDAKYYSIVRLGGTGPKQPENFNLFPEAVERMKSVPEPMRCGIYAFTAEGRGCLLPVKKWEHFMELWKRWRT